MKAKDLDKIFDDGEIDIIERLDNEANRLGVPRQSLIKVWIGEHLKAPKSKRPTKAKETG